MGILARTWEFLALNDPVAGLTFGRADGVTENLIQQEQQTEAHIRDKGHGEAE